MHKPAGQLAFPALTFRDKLGLVIFAFIIVAFACLVEKRSAFMQRRMTDAGVYFRAAWAVRSGNDIYRIADDNRWHYNYPPLLAILLQPLADAPADQPRDGLLPYPVCVGLWFTLNFLCVLLAVHWLARALEEASPDPVVQATPWGSRDWWARRMVPLLVCLPPIAHTLMRGQVNLILLLLIAGMLRGMVRHRNKLSGMWLAGAICLKIIPAFLLLYPLWRRDRRALAGCAAGLVIGLGIIPVVALGPERTAECYAELANGVLLPGLTHNGDQTRAKELTNITGTGSQSLVVVAHNTLYPNPETRPDHAEPWLRFAALATGGVLALITLWAAQRRFRRPGQNPAAETYLAYGALILVMLLTSPISHMHYQCLCVPLVMGLLVLYPPRGGLRWAWLGLITVFYASHTLPHVPELSYLRDFGMAMYVSLLMWLLAVAALAGGKPISTAVAESHERRLAA